jgi:hypothetical protein
MNGEITEIKIKQPKNSELPEGYYLGALGAYTITIYYKEHEYALKVKEGIRGFNQRVVVHIKDGVGTYEYLNN